MNETNETKRRIMKLIEQYGTARSQEELAGSRDAPGSVVKRHYDRGQQAWEEIGQEIDALLTATRPTQKDG
jgi:hypothetical protein